MYPHGIGRLGHPRGCLNLFLLDGEGHGMIEYRKARKKEDHMTLTNKHTTVMATSQQTATKQTTCDLCSDRDQYRTIQVGGGCLHGQPLHVHCRGEGGDMARR